MASKVGIANITLSHLAVGKEIANLETDKSDEAGTIRRYYKLALEVTLRDFPWPFATRFANLALIEENPTTEWAFSYRYPSEARYMRRIFSGIRNDTRQTRVPYRIASDSAGQLLFTDAADAEIEYTVQVDDPQLYPSDFQMAFSFYLAFLAAPRITSGDQFKLGERAQRNYFLEISRAVSRATNEEQPEESPESEFINARL